MEPGSINEKFDKAVQGIGFITFFGVLLITLIYGLVSQLDQRKVEREHAYVIPHSQERQGRIEQVAKMKEAITQMEAEMGDEMDGVESTAAPYCMKLNPKAWRP